MESYQMSEKQQRRRNNDSLLGYNSTTGDHLSVLELSEFWMELCNKTRSQHSATSVLLVKLRVVKTLVQAG